MRGHIRAVITTHYPFPYILGAVLAAAAAGCAPATFDEDDDTDVIATVRAPGKDFSGFRTYAISEPVQDLGALAEDPITVNHAVVDPLILSSLEAEMNAAGYQRVPDPMDDNPDVVVIPGVVATNNWGWVSYYPWYGYTGYYWYYPPVPVPVNTPSGSVVVVMVQPGAVKLDADKRNLVPVIWMGALRSLLTGSGSAASGIPEQMDQMFEQSPYLRVGSAATSALSVAGGAQ
jgi:hypothetical protein